MALKKDMSSTVSYLLSCASWLGSWYSWSKQNIPKRTLLSQTSHLHTQEKWWEKARDLWTMRLTAAGEAASTFPATKMKIVGKIAKASSAQTVTRTSFCSLDTPEAWGKNHLHRKLPFAFLRRLGSHFSVLHWSTVPCLWAFQKHPLLPTGSAWSPRECAGLIWAPGVTGDSIQALERNNCSAQLKEKNILRTKTCTFQPKSGTRDLGGRTQDNKATEYMRCALQCSFQAEHLGKREGLLCHHCFLWWENLGAGGTTGWD